MKALARLVAAISHATSRLRGRIPARPGFEAAAAQWDAAGRPGSLLPTGYDFLRLTSWEHTTRTREHPSATLRAYITAARQYSANIAEYDALLRQRDYCSGCGEGTYRLENLGICTHCDAVWCSSCPARRARHANGTRVCRCGGEIVG